MTRIADRQAVTTLRGDRTRHLLSFGLIVVTAILLALAALEAAFVIPPALATGQTIGLDLAIYTVRAESWLAGDGFYQARQLVGPYNVVHGDSMYPPTLLYLLVPFTVLPAFLWWAIPLGTIAASLWKMRPAPWAWPILALILVWPRTWSALLYGNPSLWAFAALTAGLVWTWPLAFVPLKLTLGPFALLGVRHRRFWVGALIALALCLPFGSMWFEYITVLSNARNEFGLDYVWGEIPIALALVIVSLGQPRPRSGAP